MLNTIKKLVVFFRGDSQPDSNSLPHSRTYQQSMLADGSETATRGQLVQIMMRDLVRKSGIPPGWIQCHIQIVSSRERGQGIHVRLAVKHWDERLMTYAFAFQKALLTEVVQFEPKAATWLQGISWQLEVADSCPVTELPGSHFWQTREKKAEKEAFDPFEIIPMPASAMPSHVPSPTPLTVPQPRVSASVLPLVAAASLPMLDVADEPSAPENDTEQDLERLFAIRDRELENMAINNLLPVGYEKTEPSPL